jgi:preprotein translocase subunit SecY
MMVAIFRLGAAIPVPGMNKEALASLFSNEEGMIGFFNLMSGGAFKNFTIFALGISPYITASIIVNLLQMIFPYFENLAKEGEIGRKKMVQYTRYGTVVLAVVQAFGITVGLFKQAFINYNTMSVAISVLTLTAGTAFLMYLGEKINEKGIGNGISLFIFAGIVARFPTTTIQSVTRVISGDLSIFSIILFIVVAVVVIAGVIYVTQGQRKIPVQYAKRMVGRKMYGGQSSFIPLKVNQAGVIPVIFAISLLMFPITIAQFWPQSGFYAWLDKYFDQASILYNVLNFALIVFFTYFYTTVQFNPVNIAENMKQNGGFVPGIRPGRPTADYLMKIVMRLTLVGGVFLGIIATIPNIILAFGELQISFGGTSLLIVVGVAIETMKAIEAQITMRNYQGFLK